MHAKGTFVNVKSLICSSEWVFVCIEAMLICLLSWVPSACSLRWGQLHQGSGNLSRQ